MARDSQWFEMKSQRKPRLRKASWIPLYREIETTTERWPSIGFDEEVVATRSAIFPDDVENLEEQLDWDHLHLAHGNRPEANEAEYSPARQLWNHRVEQDEEFVDGEFLVFEHRTTGGREVLISPDLICALRLERLGDAWVYPTEGYSEVIRQLRADDGIIRTVEIRAKHLKDYLCARKSQLVVGTFRHRRAILSAKPNFRPEDHCDEYSWYEFGFREIDESGGDYGVPFGVTIIGYSETDQDDDVPSYGFDDERETWTTRTELKREGRKNYFVGAEMVLMEIVPPSNRSPIVRGDDVSPNIQFIVDNDDARQTAVDLVRPPYGWLWFSPSLILSVLSHPKTGMQWLTENTGMLVIPAHQSVHFAVNQRNLINFFGKDIGELPLWWQERFVSHNVPPDGGVSPELTAAQMESRPARTMAPEARLCEAVEMLNHAIHKRFGRPLFIEHEAGPQLWRNIHRFASIEDSGFYELAKNIVRTVIERMDAELLKSQTKQMDSGTRSIKRLAEIVNQLGEDGRGATTVLVGLNELRQRDSHLPSEKELDHAYEMVGVDRNEPALARGKKLIGNTADCIRRLSLSLTE